MTDQPDTTPATTAYFEAVEHGPFDHQRDAFERGYEAGERAERQRTAPLLAAYHRLYEVVWNQTATVDLDVPGYNGLSYDDTNVIDEAGSAVEELLATGAFADLLDGGGQDTHKPAHEPAPGPLPLQP